MTFSPPGLYHTQVYSFLPSPKQSEELNYWLGLLNSKIMWWFISNTGYVLRGYDCEINIIICLNCHIYNQ
jgi:hypothetical protein